MEEASGKVVSTVSESMNNDRTAIRGLELEVERNNRCNVETCATYRHTHTPKKKNKAR